jgi:hypothetical protein
MEEFIPKERWTVVKGNDIRILLDRHGFDALSQKRRGEHRFRLSALHVRRNVRLTVWAPRFKQGTGSKKDRHTVIVEITDGSDRAIPLVEPVRQVSRLADVQDIVKRVADGLISAAA